MIYWSLIDPKWDIDSAYELGIGRIMYKEILRTKMMYLTFHIMELKRSSCGWVPSQHRHKNRSLYEWVALFLVFRRTTVSYFTSQDLPSNASIHILKHKDKHCRVDWEHFSKCIFFFVIKPCVRTLGFHARNFVSKNPFSYKRSFGGRREREQKNPRRKCS